MNSQPTNARQPAISVTVEDVAARAWARSCSVHSFFAGRGTGFVDMSA